VSIGPGTLYEEQSEDYDNVYSFLV